METTSIINNKLYILHIRVVTGIFAVRYFAVGYFALRNFRRMKITPYGNFAVGNIAVRIFCRTEILP